MVQQEMDTMQLEVDTVQLEVEKDMAPPHAMAASNT